MNKTAEKKPAAKKKTETVKAGAKVKVTQTGSSIRCIKKQRDTLIGLGLNKINRSKVLEDTPAIRGMIRVVNHLITVETA